MDENNNFGGDFWWTIEDAENGGSSGLAIEYCIHDWVKYEGFTDAFEYCSKCDTKNR